MISLFLARRYLAPSKSRGTTVFVLLSPLPALAGLTLLVGSVASLVLVVLEGPAVLAKYPALPLCLGATVLVIALAVGFRLLFRGTWNRIRDSFDSAWASQVGVVAMVAYNTLTLGILALVVSLALLSGFQTNIRNRLLAETPHLLVTPAGRGEFHDADRVAGKLAAVPGVASVSPVAKGRVWVSLGSQAMPAVVVGREKQKGLVLDASQARPIGLVAGETVTLVSSRSRLSPLGPVPIVATMKIAAIAPSATGRKAAEGSMPLEDARRLFALGPDGSTGYELRLSEPAKAADAARAVAAALGPSVAVATWEEQNRALVLALRLERYVLFAAVFLIVIVAGLNLAATSAVLAATRAGDAAVLSVLGASPRTVGRVFLAAGAGVGAAGTLGGLALGVGAAVFLERTGLIPLPVQLYGMGHAPFRVEPLDVLAVGVLSVLWSFLAASLPARTAARLSPVEALRGA